MAVTKKPKKKYDPNKYAGRLTPVWSIQRKPITEQENYRLKAWPHLALRDLELGQGTADDWETVRFRVVSARFAAQEVYNEDTSKEILAVEKLMNQAISEWERSPDVLSTISHDLSARIGSVLRAADEMQDDIPRSVLLRASMRCKTLFHKQPALKKCVK